MSAAQACPGHFLPKKCLGRRSLRECTSRKRENIVLIEVDEDFGDVIILDVPESFHKKFMKKPKHVISIDDDDDGDDESRSGACNPDGDATTSNRGSPPSVAHSSNSANADEDVVSEGNIPVKLPKSKRTYSNMNVSRNRYGLCSDDICSSDSDCSDCEFMGDSSGKLNELWEKTSSPRPQENKSGTSAPSQPVHDSAEEVIAEHSEPPGYQSAKQCSADVSDPSSNRWCFNHEKDYFNDSAKELSGQSNCIQQDGGTKEMSEACIGVKSANIEEFPHLNVESSCPASSDGEQKAGSPSMLSKDYPGCSNEVPENEANFSYDETCIITDRQKMKETDEYKRAMEEEWASRQEQLQRQAEEARRLRRRKKAENMRIMVNERRQMQRLEEMRETRRKDEENSNLKDQLRAEVKKELDKLETTCGDMSSLLRCLGIHVGGGWFPSPNEIQAAYKRACLKFHPDRFGKSNLRQQVEAEEKFKLISTMRHKLLFK